MFKYLNNFYNFLKFYVEHTESARAQICNRALHAPVIDAVRQQAARAWRTMSSPGGGEPPVLCGYWFVSELVPITNLLLYLTRAGTNPVPLLVRKYSLLKIVGFSLVRHPRPICRIFVLLLSFAFSMLPGLLASVDIGQLQLCVVCGTVRTIGIEGSKRTGGYLSRICLVRGCIGLILI